MEIGFSSTLDLVSDGEYHIGDWFQFTARPSLSETIIKQNSFQSNSENTEKCFSSTLDLVSDGDYYNGDWFQFNARPSLWRWLYTVQWFSSTLDLVSDGGFRFLVQLQIKCLTCQRLQLYSENWLVHLQTLALTRLYHMCRRVSVHFLIFSATKTERARFHSTLDLFFKGKT